MIVGITGTLGSGKGTVVEYLVEKKGLAHFSVTGFMKSVALERGLALSRMTYHQIANEFRNEGSTALIEATIAHWNRRGVSDNYVIEALHTVPEVNFIQSVGGKVIAVDAELRTRYERIVKRGSEKDTMTFEEFSAHEALEMNSDNPDKNNLAATISASDFNIQNNGTLEELHRQVDEVLANFAN